MKKEDKARESKENRLQEVYDKIPGIREIDENPETGIEISKILIRGVDNPEKLWKTLNRN